LGSSRFNSEIALGEDLRAIFSGISLVAANFSKFPLANAIFPIISVVTAIFGEFPLANAILQEFPYRFDIWPTEGSKLPSFPTFASKTGIAQLLEYTYMQK
jgi:hypothetical protein